MAAAARHSPAAPGAAERAYSFTQDAGGDDADRRRALAAWRSLGQPRRLAVTDELSLVGFGTPPAVVVEFDHVAPDGALDQHNHRCGSTAARALRSGSPRRRSRGAHRAVASRSSAVPAGGAAVRFGADVEAALDADALASLRAALADALSGVSERARAGPQRPLPVWLGPQVQALLRALAGQRARGNAYRPDGCRET